VMLNDAAGGCARHRMMPGDMAGDCADRGTLDTSLRTTDDGQQGH